MGLGQLESEMQINIKRIRQFDCTLGVLWCDGLRLFTLELPYKNNKKDVSCIKPGEYDAFVAHSNKNGGDVIWLKDVEDRTAIQIHAGNYTTDIQGCILVGNSIADINGDGIPDVTSSKKSLLQLLNKLQDCEQFKVIIEG